MGTAESKLAAVSGKFVFKCHSRYSPSEYLLFDESFAAFRCRCHFRMYMHKNLYKCGIKIMILANTH